MTTLQQAKRELAKLKQQTRPARIGGLIFVDRAGNAYSDYAGLNPLDPDRLRDNSLVILPLKEKHDEK